MECMGEVEEAMETYQEVLVMEPGCEEAIVRFKTIKDDKDALQDIIEIVLDDVVNTTQVVTKLLPDDEIRRTVKTWISAEVEEAEKLSEKLCYMVYRQHGQDR
jgi:hypothetical protein